MCVCVTATEKQSHQSAKSPLFGHCQFFSEQTRWCLAETTTRTHMANTTDHNRELRAMILAALPYPPLPVEARHFDEDGNQLGDSTMVTSHDIISNLVEQSWTRDQSATSREKMERQREVLRCFLSDLVRNGIPAVDALYEVYCKHTRDHIATYYPKDHVPELKFFPLSHVCKGDKVHIRTCDWMAAQSRLLELTDGFTAADWLPRHYHELLDVARSRLVTEEPLQVPKGEEEAETNRLVHTVEFHDQASVALPCTSESNSASSAPAIGPS